MRISDWSSDVCSSDLHRLALGHRVAHFETSAAVRLRAAEEVEVGQHRIGAFNQGNVGAIDPSRLLARINQVHRHFLVEWEQPLDAELRAQGLELPPELARIGTEHVRAGEVERADHGAQPSKAVEERSEEHTSELQSLMRNSY